MNCIFDKVHIQGWFLSQRFCYQNGTLVPTLFQHLQHSQNQCRRSSFLLCLGLVIMFKFHTRVTCYYSRQIFFIDNNNFRCLKLGCHVSDIHRETHVYNSFCCLSPFENNIDFFVSGNPFLNYLNS